ncbi:MAG: NRDE family protein [Cytophagales bacterium]|nr:MAG: NRDE family protein [Cytophagales bacterium]
MCLITFAWKAHPRYKLVFISNRDEFYQRPTLPLQRWQQQPHIFSGIDQKGGGTWLGLTEKGRFAALTNYRDPKNINENAPSRGFLTTDFLSSATDPLPYLEQIKAENKPYNGFNLLVGKMQDEQLYYYSNYAETIQTLEAGIYGLSNHLLNTSWFKVRTLKEGFQNILANEEQLDVGIFFDLLHNTTPAPENELQQTGLSTEMETMLSPIFIKSPHYGSCASSVILLDYKGHITFAEKNYNTPDQKNVIQLFRFKL